MFELCYGFLFDQGFRKVNKELWEFANIDFVRDQPLCMKNIHRHKVVHSHSLQNANGQGVAAPLTKLERWTLKANIKKYKHDKEKLFLELQIKEHEKKMNEIKLQYLKNRLEPLERKQQSTLYYVSHVLKKPENDNGIWTLTEITERKRRIPRKNHF